MIRGAPPYGMEQHGPVLFAGQGREQYIWEGIIVALWTLGCGVSLASLYASSKSRYFIVQHVGVLLSMSAFILLGIQIWNAYVDKTRW